jgi:hypothetical protein
MAGEVNLDADSLLSLRQMIIDRTEQRAVDAERTLRIVRKLDVSDSGNTGANFTAAVSGKAKVRVRRLGRF